MAANILDGNALAAKLKDTIREQVLELRRQGITPGLATVLVGEDPGSKVYIRNKIKSCEAVGMVSFHHSLPATASQKDLLALVQKLNNDPKVHGILVQLPLPQGLSAQEVILALDPRKDVDCFHPWNVGRFMIQKSWADIERSQCLLPCTPYGIITMLELSQIPIAGTQAVVVGRSNLVGKPVAALLAACDATVTLCHSQTKNLPKICQEADILVVAVGRPKYIPGAVVKQGAVVIDVGMNRTAQGLCGDVDFESARQQAGWITPVPGGVGPMTVTMLLANTVKAVKLQQEKK